MSEENNAVLLNEEELDQVAGGKKGYSPAEYSVSGIEDDGKKGFKYGSVGGLRHADADAIVFFQNAGNNREDFTSDKEFVQSAFAYRRAHEADFQKDIKARGW